MDKIHMYVLQHVIVFDIHVLVARVLIKVKGSRSTFKKAIRYSWLLKQGKGGKTRENLNYIILGHKYFSLLKDNERNKRKSENHILLVFTNNIHNPCATQTP